MIHFCLFIVATFAASDEHLEPKFDRQLLVRIASDIQAYEVELSKMEGTKIPQKSQEGKTLHLLQQRHEHLSLILRKLRHNKDYKPVIAVLTAETSKDLVHANMALRSLLPQIEQRDQPLVASLKALGAARSDILEEKGRHKEIQNKISHLYKEMSQQLELRSMALDERPPENRGRRSPAAGVWTSCFNSTEPQYEHCRKGAILTTRSSALVTSPITGEVLSAGPISSHRGEGVVIRRADQHFLLVGLGSLMIKKGQRLATGEPIGRMPVAVTVQGEKIKPRLYMEAWISGNLEDPEMVLENNAQ